MDIESNPGPVYSDLSKFHLNIRSVRNKLKYVEDIAGEYDIICLTETQLDEQVSSDNLLLPGYHKPFRLDINFSGGGILIYVNDLIKVSHRPDLEFPDGEVIWIQIEFPHNKILICTIYRPGNAVTPFGKI